MQPTDTNQWNQQPDDGRGESAKMMLTTGPFWGQKQITPEPKRERFTFCPQKLKDYLMVGYIFKFIFLYDIKFYHFF